MFEYEKLVPIESYSARYHFNYDGRRFDDSLIDVLNVLGRERWQLVGMEGKHYILMRLK